MDISCAVVYSLYPRQLHPAKGVFAVVLTLRAHVYFCLLPQAYRPRWTFKHMLTGLEAALAGALPKRGEPGDAVILGEAFILLLLM